MSNDERAAFEAQYAKTLNLARPGGIYMNHTTAMCWDAWQARAAIAQQPAKRDDTGRTPTDYALEHAEYLARGAEQFIDAVNRYAKATTEITEESEVEQAEQSVTEHGRGLRCDIYEFRKRRDRAAIAQPAEPAKPRKTRWHVGEKALTPYGIGTVSRISSGVGFTEYFFADLQLPAGRFAVNERDMQEAPAAQADAQPVAPIEDPVTVPRGLLGAACAAIDRKHDAPKTLAELRRYTVGDLSAAAAPPARQPQWLPIDTAPKDGSLFLCWVYAVRYGETDEGQQYQQDASQVDFCSWREGPSDFPPGHGYFDPCCGEIGDSHDVTHWMPLPPPPGGIGREGK